jgi:hypothetical protein
MKEQAPASIQSCKYNPLRVRSRFHSRIRDPRLQACLLIHFWGVAYCSSKSEERLTTLLRNRSLLIITAVLLASAGAQAQKVAFIGDDFTYNWQSQPQFTANTNWEKKATYLPFAPGEGRGTAAAIIQLQAIIKSGQKPVVHLLAGENDSDGVTPGNPGAVLFEGFATNVVTIIKMAQSAHLKLIVGTIPFSDIGSVSAMNQWLMMYCAEHGVPVVNYAFALNSGTGFAASIVPSYYQQEPSNYIGHVLSPAGWDLITDMAKTQIGMTAGMFGLIGGFLNTVAREDLEDPRPLLNVNTVVAGSLIQFTPYGKYSDGKSRILNNADISGHIGIWTSSAHNVVWIDQNGVGTALEPGSSNVKFTTLSGTTIDEWTMNTDTDDPCGCLSSY